MGRIFRLGETPGASGSYEAPVHDSGSVSRWGSISWRADTPAGWRAGVSHPLGEFDQAGPHLERLVGARGQPGRLAHLQPNARYIQWKVNLNGSGGATPVLDNVTVAYLPRNLPPVVKSIGVITRARPCRRRPGLICAVLGALQHHRDGYRRFVRDLGRNPHSTLSRASSDQISITWQAETRMATAWSTTSISGRRRDPVEAAEERCARQLDDLGGPGFRDASISSRW